MTEDDNLFIGAVRELLLTKKLGLRSDVQAEAQLPEATVKAEREAYRFQTKL